MKGVLHVHSPWSHDACDDQGLVNGAPNATCLAELRAAPCKAGLDFVALTDHPTHMNEATPQQNVLYDASKGDQLVYDPAQPTAPIGNMLVCPDGRKVLLGFGYEGTHTLPLFFKKQPTKYEAYASPRPLADVQALVADLKSAGAVVGLAHSEQDDLPESLIVDAGAEAMEWYNPHGNFLTALGGDKVTGAITNVLPLLGKMNPFLAGSSSGAHADLVYLVLLPSWPVKGFEKWRTVQQTRFVPGMLGSDVHENVSVDPVCKGAAAAACSALAGSNQSALAALVTGGQLMLNDGRRMDAYERLFRWLNNRVLANELTPAAISEAIRRGRSYGVFSVFGDPNDFSYEGAGASGPLDMGDAAKGPISLSLRVPTPRAIDGGAPFDANAAKNVVLRAVIFRTDASGTVEVARSTTLGDTLKYNATAPGSYHAEIWVKPRHLLGALGSATNLADTEYMWLITNPIRVTP